MASTNLIIGPLVGTIGVGGIATGGYFGYQALNKEQKVNEIRNKLVSRGYTILTSDSTDWKDILVSYAALTESENDLKFGTFDGKGDKAAEELAKYCQKLLDPHTSEDIKNEKNYKKAEKWCVVPVTVLDILKYEKYTALNTAKTSNKVQDNKEWETKIKEHKKSNQKINDLGLDSRADTVTDEDVQKIKTKCKEIGAKKNHEKDYDTNLKNFRLWCSNKAQS